MREWVAAAMAWALIVLNGTTGWAQEDLEQGKSGAQLFASSCALCHKSVRALLDEGYPSEAFLRVHYTSSRETAARLFVYLRETARADAKSAPKRNKLRATDEGASGKTATPKTSGAPAGKPKAPESKPDQKKD